MYAHEEINDNLPSIKEDTAKSALAGFAVSFFLQYKTEKQVPENL